MKKSTISGIIFIIVFLLSLFMLMKWDGKRIDNAQEQCLINCGEFNYTCRNLCFRYEYGGIR